MLPPTGSLVNNIVHWLIHTSQDLVLYTIYCLVVMYQNPYRVVMYIGALNIN